MNDDVTTLLHAQQRYNRSDLGTSTSTLQESDMIPETSREALGEAINRFDRDYRNRSEWQDGEDNKNYKFVIEHDGRHHPVNTIIFHGDKPLNMAVRTAVTTVRRMSRRAADVGFATEGSRRGTTGPSELKDLRRVHS